MDSKKKKKKWHGPRSMLRKLTSLKFDFQKSLMYVEYICNSCFFEVEFVVIPLSLYEHNSLIIFTMLMRFSDLLLNFLELIMLIAPFVSEGNLEIVFLILNQEIIKCNSENTGTVFLHSIRLTHQIY